MSAEERGEDVVELFENDPPYELDGEPAVESSPPSGRGSRRKRGVVKVKNRRDLKIAAQTHRLAVTVVLIALVAAAGAGMFIGAINAEDEQEWARLERAAEIFLVPMFTLLGTAVGWYFGGSSRKK